jgi:hypothetical protein
MLILQIFRHDENPIIVYKAPFTISSYAFGTQEWARLLPYLAFLVGLYSVRFEIILRAK